METIAKEKGCCVSAVAVAKEEEEEEEEEAFDFDCVSEEECDGKCEAECSAKCEECPQQPSPQAPQPSADSTAADSTAADSMVVEDDDDGSEDLVDYEMPEIEAGEMEKIEDPLANEENGGRRKRAHPKVDYVALEAQLKKEEEEMRQKMAKQQWCVC